MSVRRILPFLALGLILILAACSGSSDKANPNSESYTVTMNVLPDPPVVGDVLLYFTVLDVQGVPISGATVEVGADHIDMTGMGMHGPATDQGKGIYAVTTNFSMSGNWKISVRLEDGAKTYSKEFQLIIQ